LIRPFKALTELLLRDSAKATPPLSSSLKAQGFVFKKIHFRKQNVDKSKK